MASSNIVIKLCVAVECMDRDCSSHSCHREEFKSKGYPIVWRDFSKTCPDYIEPEGNDDEFKY